MRLGSSLQARKWHKWLGLLLAAQVLLWVASGLFMTAADIGVVRGDSIVRNVDVALPESAEILPLEELQRRYGAMYGVRLKALPGFEHPLYELDTLDGLVMLDAVTGESLAPLSEARIRALARAYYAGEGEIVRAALIEEVPVEIRNFRSYLWRVDFDGWLAPSLYIDPESGALVTQRHRIWRIYDAFWMLHIMDYGDSRDDVNNTLLRVASAVGVVFGLTGIWLLFFSFRRRRPQRVEER